MVSVSWPRSQMPGSAGLVELLFFSCIHSILGQVERRGEGTHAEAQSHTNTRIKDIRFKQTQHGAGGVGQLFSGPTWISETVAICATLTEKRRWWGSGGVGGETGGGGGKLGC